MKNARSAFTWVIAAVALGAIAAWPTFVKNGADAAHAASLPTPAPVNADYKNRDRLIAFWERAVAERHQGDMLSTSRLSAEYLQRYRERGDIDDVVRALHTAQSSLRVQPIGNAAAEVDFGSALLTLHRFREALAVTRHIERYDPTDVTVKAREASLDLELGRYDDAARIVRALQRDPQAGDESVQTLIARYDELTGHLSRARERFTKTAAYANARYDSSAQQRAWYSFRLGELAFEAGDNTAAVAAERAALETFPEYSEANRMLARIECSMHRWQECLDAASAAARVTPYPEVLGYEADAQRALGDDHAAAQTEDLIRAVERIGNAQHVSDRLLAIYYAEHRVNVDDAYRIAKGELAVRDDIFTEDTLAWAAAADGRWDEARGHIASALRFDTENSLLQYHAGIIALHFGRRDEARQRLERAIALNPQFHPSYADDARARLARL